MSPAVMPFSHPQRSATTEVYASFVCVLVLAVCFLDFGNYLFTASAGAILPKHVYFLLCAAVLPLLLAAPRSAARYLHTEIARWFAAMFVLNFLHLSFSLILGNEQAAVLTWTRAQFMILAGIFGFAIYRTRPKVIGMTCAGLALLLTALQIIDFFNPGMLVPLGTEGAVLGRAGSTLVNANKAAESLVLLSLIAMAALPPGARFLVILLVLPGVFVSFSRAGSFAWALAALGTFWFGSTSRKSYYIIAAFLLLVLSLGLEYAPTLIGRVDPGAQDNLFARLSFFSTLNIHDQSSEERLSVFWLAAQSFLQSPIYGMGAGYTYLWPYWNQPPHNQHVLILAEYGILGYAMFVWLGTILYKGGRYFHTQDASGLHSVALLIFLVITPFSHNMFDNLYWLVAIALVGQRTAVTQQR